MPEGHLDTDRSVVKTYVPAYQKERWQRQAERLEMSQSEFVRTMVQAGRRGFTGFEDDGDSASESPEESTHDETSDSSSASGTADTTPAAGPEDRIDDHVIDRLSADQYRSWERLRDGLATELVDDRLEDALQRLQRENRVQYSGRHGGYTLVADR